MGLLLSSTQNSICSFLAETQVKTSVMSTVSRGALLSYWGMLTDAASTNKSSRD